MRGLAGNIPGDELEELFGAGTVTFFLCAGVRRVCTVAIGFQPRESTESEG